MIFRFTGLWMIPAFMLISCQHPESVSRIADENEVVRDDKALYQSCLLCHSNKEMQRGPVLDGMESWYILDQLKKFKNGQRGRDPKNRAEFLMAASMARFRDEKEMVRVADYIANLPPKPSITTVKGNMEHGRVLYLGCIGCHGSKGEGRSEVKAPALLIQEDWFLLDQLRKYRNGLRGTHPDDIFGRAMVESIRNWPDKDLKDVTVYLNSL
jgi:cytochrome c oxidase subunit 2